MTTAVVTHRLEFSSFADTALKIATRFWFVVTVVGQLAFAVAVASYYGMAMLRGDHLAWGKFISHGYVPGDHMGNLAVAIHLSMAVAVMLSGALQLVPRVRNRFPAFHRWNGRLYMLAALGVSAAGMYMTWIRGSVGDLTLHIGSTLNAILIWFFGAMALRYALARDFRSHRRWALRFFLVVSASWFIRIMLFLSIVVLNGTVGFNPAMLTGSLLTIMTFAQYLVPLAVLEMYFRAQDRPTARRKMATAGVLGVSTLLMIAGLFAVSMAVWVPQVKAGFDARKAIADTMAATIASDGVDQAVAQYHQLKSTQPTTYKFEEDQLNSLGYQLINSHKYREAIRIMQLNTKTYPQSANTWDSLAEAYMYAGDKGQAIANYQRSLQLNPKNANAVKILKKLGAQ
jgi:hypothetical protein